jgi:hypothetical protein
MAYIPPNANGQAPMANSSPVVFASDQTALPLSALASTSTLQTTANASLVSITTNTGNIAAQGAATVANSNPVNIASDQIIPVLSRDLFVLGAAAQTAIVANILPAASGATGTDLSGYRAALVQVVSTGTGGTFIFEGSNDPSLNYQTVVVYNNAQINGTAIAAAITATATQIGYIFPVHYRYYRLRIVTTITGGSIQAQSRFTQASWTPSVMQVAQLTAGNLNSNVSGSLSTVTTVTGVTTLANGQTAHSAVNTTLDTTLVQGDASDLFISTAGQLVQKQFSTAENDWQATSGITALATTTSTALKAAGAASTRNFVTGAQIYNNSATTSTLVSILDGATVLWTGFLPATTAALPIVPTRVTFATPLRGTAATAMNIQLGTAGASVFYNVQGYQSF